MFMTSGITAFERLMHGYFLRESLTPFSGLVVAESSYVGVSGGPYRPPAVEGDQITMGPGSYPDWFEPCKDAEFVFSLGVHSGLGIVEMHNSYFRSASIVL